MTTTELVLLLTDPYVEDTYCVTIYNFPFCWEIFVADPVSFCVVPSVAVEGGTVTVRKIVLPSTDTTVFSFTTDLDIVTDFSLANGEDIVFTDIQAGTYFLEEIEDPGYTTTVDVSNGSLPEALEVGEGEDVEVIYTNTLNSGCQWKLYEFDVKVRFEDRA